MKMKIMLSILGFSLFLVLVLKSNIFSNNSMVIWLRTGIDSCLMSINSSVSIKPTSNDVVVLSNNEGNSYKYRVIGRFLSVDWNNELLSVLSAGGNVYSFILGQHFLDGMRDAAKLTNDDMENMWSAYPLLLVITWNDERLLNKIEGSNNIFLNVNMMTSINIAYTKYDGSEEEYVREFFLSK